MIIYFLFLLLISFRSDAAHGADKKRPVLRSIVAIYQPYNSNYVLCYRDIISSNGGTISLHLLLQISFALIYILESVCVTGIVIYKLYLLFEQIDGEIIWSNRGRR